MIICVSNAYLKVGMGAAGCNGIRQDVLLEEPFKIFEKRVFSLQNYVVSVLIASELVGRWFTGMGGHC